MSDVNKDVVGARINLDTSKILSSFKMIDDGARGNAESFKLLNTELTVTQKNYISLASAADKMALTSEERRKKILAESDALVKQRTSQAELYNAKKNQLDQTNNLVESKLKVQQTILKQREDAIEQQEQRHQQRMAALNQRTAAASGQDNLIQAKIDREFQIMKQGDARLEMEAERHAKQMAKLAQISTVTTTQSNDSGLFDRMTKYAQHALVFNTIMKASHVAQQSLREGLVGIEANMAGYVQTNEHYFLEYNEGTKEMVMNTQKLHSETTSFIRTAHDLGSEIMDVTESARLWGRMYKDAAIVQEMVRKSTMLSTVDLVSLEDATKSMESTLAQYGVQIVNSNDAMVQGGRILDSWSKVAHDTMAPAKDLGDAYQRTGKIAAETGVSFDIMNGLISSGVRNTALGGANLGNMWKTVLGTIRTDKAVAEIESLGVATKEVVEGKEQWRRADDILLDLSTKVIDKNYDLTQSYADISRGVYQYAKFAASLNAGDILLGTAASIGSTGSTLEYLKVQMDTIQRKAAQTKTSLLEIFNQAGDDGLRTAIKRSLDIIDQLLIGLTKIPTGAIGATASIAGMIAVYKRIAPLLVQWKAAQTALSTAIAMHTTVQTAATAEMVVFTAAARAAMITTAAWTAGITLLVGVIALFVFQSGKAEKAQREHTQALKDQDAANQQIVSQYERQIELLPKLVSAHKSLKESINSGSMSAEKQSQVKKQLEEVSKALVITLGEEGAKQLEAANYTDAAVQIQVKVLNDLITKQNEARKNVLLDQQSSIEQQLINKTEALSKAKEKLAKDEELIAKRTESGMKVKLRHTLALEDSKNKVEELTTENNKLEESLANTNTQLGQMAVDGLDQLAGKAGVSSESVNDMGEALADLREQIEGNGSSISELNSLLKELSGEQSLNASNATDLILKYPQLADEIYKTADGWKFEKDAVEILRKAKIQKAIDDLKAEKASSFNTKIAVDERLKAYGIEASAIKSLADLKAQLNGTTSSVRDDRKFINSGGFSDSLGSKEAQQAYIDGVDAKAKQAADIRAIYNEYEKEMAGYDTKINALGALYKDPDFGVSSDKGKKGKTGKSDAEKAADKAKKEAEKSAKDAATARKDSYADDLDNFKYVAERQDWSIDQQIAGYNKLRTRHKQLLTEDKDSVKQWVRDVQKLNDSRYEEDVNNLEKKKERMRQANMSEVEMTKASITFYEKEQSKSYLLKSQKLDIQKQIFDQTAKYNELKYSNSMDWISKEASKMEMAGKSKTDILDMELKAYQRMSKDKDRTSSQSFEVERKIYDQRKSMEQEYLSDFKKNLDYKKNMETISLEDELKAWIVMQLMYKEGTDNRMEADVQVYALRKSLLEQEKKGVADLATVSKQKLDKVKNDAIKRIEDERDAFLAAQDDKIKAIDDEISKMQQLNEDDDYERALAEKRARLEKLQSAVGPDGIKEREQVIKDIEDMQRDHDRTLAKRSLEDQKQALQDEKTVKEKEFNDQIQAAKDHYDELNSAFESFTSDTELNAENLKRIQILKESEKNVEILAQLDQFILDYQARMDKLNTSSIGGGTGNQSVIGLSEEQQDLIRYNTNIDNWNSGDAQAKIDAHAENQKLRKKYNITKDTGKLQHFADGGIIQGRRGEPTPIIGHAGEVVLNDRQQRNLFNLFDFKMPEYGTPNVSMGKVASGGSNPVENHNQYTVTSGDTYIADESTAKVFWSERDNFVHRMQTRGGKG